MPENNHMLCLENKNYLKITGVESVICLTETEAAVVINNQVLEIKGTNLKAEELSVENGELVLIGNFVSFKYQDKKEKKSLFKRLFK